MCEEESEPLKCGLENVAWQPMTSSAFIVWWRAACAINNSFCVSQKKISHRVKNAHTSCQVDVLAIKMFKAILAKHCHKGTKYDGLLQHLTGESSCVLLLVYSESFGVPYFIGVFSCTLRTQQGFCPTPWPYSDELYNALVISYKNGAKG